MSALWGAMWVARKPGRAAPILERRDCLPLLFRTRREARAYIRERYAYIRTRRDLRAAPHHWRMPRPVRVRVVVER